MTGRAATRVDPALVEAARQGNQAALAALLRAARPQIRRYAERHCMADAEDATQEALWTVHRKIPTLRSAAAFPAWLLKIVTRICFGLVAPLWHRIERLQEDGPPVREGVDIDLRLDLANAVETLPEHYREAMVMHYYCDLPVADVATRLGITQAAARVRLHRGRERVRKRLTCAPAEN
ncbi:MAG TPA: sigma-70 family RNA polymerase sigma factor [Allosphingosinicella sp.]